jgi:hypothetical protein
MEDRIYIPYIKSYKKLYEAKFGEKKDFDCIDFEKSISKYFDKDIYIDIMNIIHKDLPSNKEESKYQILKSLKNDLFDIANKVYFQKFYEEVSLEEQMNIGSFWWDGGFSFNVSLFKPLKRSVLFNY